MRGELAFQNQIVSRANVLGGHVCDLSAVGGGVPDLSIGLEGKEYWLELKFGKFKLLHSKYDEFYWGTLTRQQLDFLIKRSREGGAVCAVLGYFVVEGDYVSDNKQAYLHCMHPAEYLEKLWQKKGYTAGAAVLDQTHTAPARIMWSARELFDFIESAALARS